MCGQGMVVPKALWNETLKKLHDRYGTVLSESQVSHMVARRLQAVNDICPGVPRESKSSKKPLITIPLLEYPWKQVATDLFTI